MNNKKCSGIDWDHIINQRYEIEINKLKKAYNDLIDYFLHSHGTIIINEEERSYLRLLRLGDEERE